MNKLPWELISAVIVAIFGSTGFWTWLTQRKASNRDILSAVQEVRNDVDKLRTKVDQMENQNAERSAVDARRHVINFNEELLRDQRHSKESFDMILSDIDEYERYCASHPGFKNNKATLSIEHIKDCYRKAEKEHDFL